MKKVERNKPKQEEAAPEAAPISVIVLNFGDSPRVLYRPNGKTVTIPVGGAVTVEQSERSVERIKARDKSLVILPEDIADKATGPFMRQVLNALRDFDSLDYDRALHICRVTLGDDAFDTPRPNKLEMRVALARRAKDAAHYIIAGAADTADKLLGEGRVLKDLELKPADGAPGLVAGDVVQGDPADNSDVSFFERPPGYVDPDATHSDGANSTDAAGKDTGDSSDSENDDGSAGADGARTDEGDAGGGGAQENSGAAGGEGQVSGDPAPASGQAPETPVSRPPRPVKGE